jgi:RNA-binding motif protein, X-linked 2
MVPSPYCPTDSRHADFKDSAYIFVGGIPYELTEGDILCVFSQYGEILDLNMPRDDETGKPKGFCFLKYDDQRSTVLAVDNFNGSMLLGRTLRVDHSRDYRQKKRRRREGESESEESEEEVDDEGRVRVKGFNVAPKGWLDPPTVEESETEREDLGEGIDIDDPMREYLIEQRKEERDRTKKRPKKIKREQEENVGRKHKHRHRHRSEREKDGQERRHRRYREKESTPKRDLEQKREDTPEMTNERRREDTPD